MRAAAGGGLHAMSSHLPIPPAVVDRGAVPYVGVRCTVTMDAIDQAADRIPDLLGWLAARGVAPAGAPFLRYLVIDMERELVVEAGVPVGAAVDGDDDVLAGVLPAGRYVVAPVVGAPDVLVGATGELLRWADERGLAWDVRPGTTGDRWGCRLETYLTNPLEEPDASSWRTELAFRLREAGSPADA